MRRTIWLALMAMLVIALIGIVAAGCGDETTTTTAAGPATTGAARPPRAAVPRRPRHSANRSWAAS